MSAKKKTGRPAMYSPELADEILRRLEESESMVKICNSAGMPSRTTVFKWIETDKSFADKYARAKDVGLEMMAEEMLKIADDPVGSTDTGATDSGAVQKQRLQVDTRKWLLSKLAPKKYGERTKVEHSGNIGLEALVHDDDAE